MIFFETNPSGRILNRFTSDTEMLDFNLLMTMGQWVNCLTAVLGSLVLISIINPWILPALPALVGIYGIDDTHPRCGGCRNHAMNSDNAVQASYWFSVANSTGGPNAPWFMRSIPYSEPNGDYTPGCWLSL